MEKIIIDLKNIKDKIESFIEKYEQSVIPKKEIDKKINDKKINDKKINDKKIKNKKKKNKKIKKLYNEYLSSVMTITFSECVENQLGMEQIGTICKNGFNLDDLDKAKYYFENLGCICEKHYLNDLLNDNDAEDAYLLVIRNGVNKLFENEQNNSNKNDLFNELKNIKWDSKYWDTRRQKVLNKNARVNTCFSTFSQEADYKNKKGTIHNFNDLKLLNVIRNKFNEIGDEFKNLNAEGNWYYNLDNCGIGMHGDAERLKVMGVRLGNQPMNLCYRWYQYSKYKEIGKFFEIMLNPGDIYIMSEISTGNNWKKRKIKTLRHCCGGDKWMAKIKKYM